MYLATWVEPHTWELFDVLSDELTSGFCTGEGTARALRCLVLVDTSDGSVLVEPDQGLAIDCGSTMDVSGTLDLV